MDNYGTNFAKNRGEDTGVKTRGNTDAYASGRRCNRLGIGAFLGA